MLFLDVHQTVAHHPWWCSKTFFSFKYILKLGPPLLGVNRYDQEPITWCDEGKMKLIHQVIINDFSRALLGILTLDILNFNLAVRKEGDERLESRRQQNCIDRLFVKQFRCLPNTK